MRAFTLLEVIISLGLIIALMSGVYGFYVGTMKARDTAVRSMRDTLLMRALLEQMAEEIRHITSLVPDGASTFSGTEEEIKFVRVRMPDLGAAYAPFDPMSTDSRLGCHDLVRVEYKLYWDEEEENLDEDGTPVCYGLRRIERPIDPNPRYVLSDDAMMEGQDESQPEIPDMAKMELIAPEIKYLKFEYLDGVNYVPRWQPLNSEDASDDDASQEPAAAPVAGPPALPQAIRITIGKVKVPRQEDEFDPSRAAELEELDKRTHHPDRWTVTVYLRQADQTGLSSRTHSINNDLDGEDAQMGKQTEGGGF